MVLETKKGYPELILMEARSVDIFYVTADWLTKKFDIAYTQKSSQEKNISWNFEHSNALMLLSYDSVTGIILCPAACAKATETDKAAFQELVTLILKLM
jgi:hypothetical protein